MKMSFSKCFAIIPKQTNTKYRYFFPSDFLNDFFVNPSEIIEDLRQFVCAEHMQNSSARLVIMGLLFEEKFYLLFICHFQKNSGIWS